MENVRRHKNIELVHTESSLEKVTAKPTYKNTTIFNEDLVATELFKSKVNLFKPIYCGMCILGMFYATNFLFFVSRNLFSLFYKPNYNISTCLLIHAFLLFFYIFY